MFFGSLALQIVMKNTIIAKEREISHLKEENLNLEATLEEKHFSFKRLSTSEKIRSKALAYDMIIPKDQYNIVYVNDSEKKEPSKLESVFVSITNMFKINEETIAKDDIK